jgi:lipopolysaccharide/colanic/teichoic acid biosynthesis glycosyltransferase
VGGGRHGQAKDVLLAQERVGLNGRRFRMLKFRTMWTDVDRYAPSPAGDVDPRITHVGRVLRTTRLDELPQLWNVLRGDMSLVGPRPEMPFIVQRYGELEQQRLLAKPGITGIWQLSADRHAEIHENVEYDLYYISHRSLTTDLLILLETLFFTIGQLGWVLRRRSAAEARPAAVGAAAAEETGSVVVALDQRAAVALSERWQQFVPAAYALADRWPVKLVVASANIAALDALLAPTIARLGTRGFRAEYVPYDGRAGLRELVRAARLVITDLPHVAATAREADVELLAIHDDTIRLHRSRHPADDLLEALDHALPQSLPQSLPLAAPSPPMRDTDDFHVRPPLYAP